MKTKLIKKLNHLSKMITKYAHKLEGVDGEQKEPSARMSRWLMEYDQIRNQNHDVFIEYCATVGASIEHDSNDLLA